MVSDPIAARELLSRLRLEMFEHSGAPTLVEPLISPVELEERTKILRTEFLR
jgi:hypothetical protein